MSYAQGSLIQATDYYSLASAGGSYTGPFIGQHWGPGTGDHGLGQNLSPIQNPPNNVAASNIITAVQWTSLINTINKCLTHQGLTQITPTGVTVGTPASYFASITTGSVLAYNNAGNTGLALTDGISYPATYNGAWGDTGAKTLVSTHTIIFASADAARYFFNAGGIIKLGFSLANPGASLLNTDWASICSVSGSIQLGYKNTNRVGGSGSFTAKNTNNGGYWNLTGSFVNHFTQMSGTMGGYYGTESISVDCMWDSALPAAPGIGGGYAKLVIRTTYNNSTALKPVTGSISTSLVVSSPSIAQLSPTWGSPSVQVAISPV